jgi:hypothetical protein
MLGLTPTSKIFKRAKNFYNWRLAATYAYEWSGIGSVNAFYVYL